MIQEADIGVGISGVEGMQAVMASDFSIAQFQFLERLLVVHGHWCYKRIAQMICYFFYKNIAFGLTIVYFEAFTGFSGQSVYDDWYMLLFNVILTLLPVISLGVFEQDVSSEVCLQVLQVRGFPFGFQTAVEMAQQAVHAAHVEAESAVNGIGFVKLMGRSTGHIALHATLSSRDVDCCLIPENDFYLEGKGGLFEFLEDRLRKNGHAVLVVAEGPGQDLIPRTDAQKEERDESGNPVFLDVGVWLKSELKKWWARDHPGELFTVKYIDPTYTIRAVPANATDSLYCTLLVHSAIHGVMAGYTGFAAGPINGNYGYIPDQGGGRGEESGEHEGP